MATIDPSVSPAASPPAAPAAVKRLEIDRFFEALVKLEGSDLHMKVGQPPFIRVKGSLQPLKTPRIDDEHMRRLCLPMLDDRRRRILDADGGCDFAYVADVDGVRWRFRVNLLHQQGSLGLVARRVNNKIPDFKGLFLPPGIEQLCQYDQGLILLAGVTGSGKSTTIASMLNFINQTHRKHILTLEDPIEFVFTEDK
jgi:twitching motility protein PilT